MNVFHLVHVAYRAFRRRVRRRLAIAERRRIRKLLAIRIKPDPRFDDRSTIDRFRRESGR